MRERVAAPARATRSARSSRALSPRAAPPRHRPRSVYGRAARSDHRQRRRPSSRPTQPREVTTEQDRGLGARYRTLMRVGSPEVGGLVEIVECDELRDLAWTSVTGIDKRGRWRLRERANGTRTRVELRLQYGVAGAGIIGWIAEQVAAPAVRE